MKPYEKIYAFGFLTVIHPSGQMDRVDIEHLEIQIKLIDNSIRDLKQQRKDCFNDIAKISSKSKIKRFFIKRKVVKDGKTQKETGQT